MYWYAVIPISSFFFFSFFFQKLVPRFSSKCNAARRPLSPNRADTSQHSLLPSPPALNPPKKQIQKYIFLKEKKERGFFFFLSGNHTLLVGFCLRKSPAHCFRESLSQCIFSICFFAFGFRVRFEGSITHWMRSFLRLL